MRSVQRLEVRKRLDAGRGFVLIAVLWMVAALSILVTGLSYTVRQEVRLASMSKQVSIASAVADGAIHLAVQNMKLKSVYPSQSSSVSLNYTGVPVRVRILPLNGLIDINNAPKELLVNLLVVAGGMVRSVADVVAQAWVERRSLKDKRGAGLGFESTEDLLAVPGIDYDLYVKINRLLTADLRGSGTVNPLSANLDVLLVLANGNIDQARRIATGRDSGAVGVDTTALNTAFVNSAPSSRISFEASVDLADGGTVQYTRTVDMGGDPREGMAWRTIRTQSRLIRPPK